MDFGRSKHYEPCLKFQAATFQNGKRIQDDINTWTLESVNKILGIVSKFVRTIKMKSKDDESFYGPSYIQKSITFIIFTSCY
jgi:hypothetical protein